MNIRQRFEELAPRERRLVYLAAGLVVAAAIYSIVVLPIQAYSSRAASRVAQKSADLAWMQQVAPQVMAAGAAGAVGGGGSGESMVVLVDRTAREAGLGASVRDQSPSGEGRHRQFHRAPTWGKSSPTQGRRKGGRCLRSLSWPVCWRETGETGHRGPRLPRLYYRP